MENWKACAVANDPLLFVTGVLCAVPEPHQVEALIALRDHGHVAIRAAHDQGKTALLAWIGWFFMTTRIPCKIPVAANTQDQLRDVTWAELMKWGRSLPTLLREQYDIGLERITLRSMPEDCFMVARTASKSNPEALQGFHSENLLFLLEEASGMEDVIFEIASGAMSSKGATALMIGNPNKSTGYFARAFKENRWLWHGLHWPWRKNPWSSESYPEQMAREYGENSNVYRIRVLGEFPTSEDNAVIPLDIIEAAIRRDVEGISSRSMVWGLDVARFGDDRCALVKRRGNVIPDLTKMWKHRDTMETCGIVMREWYETPDVLKPSAINCDVIGIGAGVVDRLRELGVPVFGVNVAELSSEPDRYLRLRDELWWKARLWFMARDCKIINDPALISDLVGPTYKALSTGKLQIESKDDMKKRGLRSPDAGDAFCLTFAGGEYAVDYRTHSKALDEGYDPLAPEQARRHYAYGEQIEAIDEAYY
jgi:hypothetical protein